MLQRETGSPIAVRPSAPSRIAPPLPAAGLRPLQPLDHARDPAVAGGVVRQGERYAVREVAVPTAAHGTGLRQTRPYRPQTGGKAEASVRILQAARAYRRPCASNAERLAALTVFLREYDHDRLHGGIGGGRPRLRL